MKTNPDMTPHELLNCEVCLNEVSAEESKLSEVDDYVMYFCGLDCYDKWHKQAKNPPEIT